MKLDHLFQRNDAGMSRRGRLEPRLQGIGRDLVTVGDEFKELEIGAEEESGTPSQRIPDYSVTPRHMSPRQLADWAHDMYLCNAFNWEEYRLAGFPAEMHPDYNRTIGALTGQYAKPDVPRDMVMEWEERLAFTLRHNDPMDPEVRRTQKVLRQLRRHEPGQRSPVEFTPR